MTAGAPRPRNLPASILDRLRNRAGAEGEELQLVLMRYALERLLYRLSCSPHREQFVLKGAMLFRVWADLPDRPTRDLNLLGYGEHDPERLQHVFRQTCTTAVEDDGLAFLADVITAEVMKEGEEYEGVRLRLEARLGSARIPVLIDVGFGDAVTPAPEEVSYPVLLDLPAPRLHVYPRETVVAEKLEALVKLGMTNSRMKDFYDLWSLSRTFAFNGPTLTRAVRATFARRGTATADEPLALTPEFAAEPARQVQWRALLRRVRIRGDVPSLEGVIDHLRRFLLPVLQAGAGGANLAAAWPPGGPWMESTANADELEHDEIRGKA
ncbi:MAG TPA: nucleotidyl transferase AbiEii/AbiGii toxin family protein [Dehalococcoidia bacterium]|nr:nucleotidyl transferase AbiEii/AbiGii toxin family protein [Dehalococcoidia bacterium]